MNAKTFEKKYELSIGNGKCMSLLIKLKLEKNSRQTKNYIL